MSEVFMRLNSYIAKSGITSRRKADKLIFEGKIKVNGKTVSNPAIDIGEKDKVEFNGKILKPQEYKYFIFNKPVKVITTANDPQGRKTVLDFFKKEKIRLFPVGRLDYDTSGLIFVTNDGEFSNKLMHPSKNKNKIYIVTSDKFLKKEALTRFSKGIIIEDRKTSASKIYFLKKTSDGYVYKVIIHEGFNRQIRKMFDYFGAKVKKLKRIEIAGVKLKNLKEGEYRELTKKEYETLMETK